MTHIDAGAELDPVHPVPVPARATGLSAAEAAAEAERSAPAAE